MNLHKEGDNFLIIPNPFHITNLKRAPKLLLTYDYIKHL
jgi:hypothetical protein